MSWASVKAPVPTPHGVKASEVEKDKIRPHLSDNVLLLKANLVKMEDFQILNCQTKPMGVIKWVKRPRSMLWRGGAKRVYLSQWKDPKCCSWNGFNTTFYFRLGATRATTCFIRLRFVSHKSHNKLLFGCAVFCTSSQHYELKTIT